MHPLIPADARITADPPTFVLDGLELPVAPAEADRLRRLAPRFNGRVPLSAMALSNEDVALVRQLRERGMLFDLRVSTDSVPTGQFCDYLYARITRWRTGKPPGRWPWRDVIACGEASTGYLQGILTENYHYVRAAVIRQSPLLSHAASAVQFDLVREFVTGEAAVLEVDPAVYARSGDPYQVWESVYGIAPEILAPVRQHIRDDVLGGHASLFRQVALDAAPQALPLGTALSTLGSARAVFDATRLWQRDMYEHYQLGGGSPAKAAL